MKTAPVLFRMSDGSWARHELAIVATAALDIECGCWQHARAPRRFQLLITNGGIYVRAGADDPAIPYRDADRSGPVGLELAGYARAEL